MPALLLCLRLQAPAQVVTAAASGNRVYGHAHVVTRAEVLMIGAVQCHCTECTTSAMSA